MLANRPIQLIGMMCYSIYMWHVLIIGKTAPRAGAYHFFIFLLSIASVSWLSYRHVEFGKVRSIRSLLPEKAIR